MPPRRSRRSPLLKRTAEGRASVMPVCYSICTGFPPNLSIFLSYSNVGGICLSIDSKKFCSFNFNVNSGVNCIKCIKLYQHCERNRYPSGCRNSWSRRKSSTSPHQLSNISCVFCSSHFLLHITFCPKSTHLRDLCPARNRLESRSAKAKQRTC